ncbi:hypothetical protein TWF696_000691 [Orbilia brochopaga]|uniref:Uncharacterized protein n=1 Tax=Orbilia brochopaga TaxID=3140254 RepID=A0AAV9VDL1_9PEZI
MVRQLRREDYTMGWVCALPIELAAAKQMLDEEHSNKFHHEANETNIYTCGRIHEHNVVIVCLPKGQIGTNSAAETATQLKLVFKSIQFSLMVGIGGGVPSEAADIRLGDVVVSTPCGTHGGVVQFDLGKATLHGFERTGSLNTPSTILLKAVSTLQALSISGNWRLQDCISKLNNLPAFNRQNAGPDILFQADYNCEGVSSEKRGRKRQKLRESRTDVEIHYGTIASGNQVIKDASERDKVSKRLGGVLCFEMEAAALMNILSCLLIRGICDYADSHKNKCWQPYAAATAAAYAKELLAVIPCVSAMELTPSKDTFQECDSIISWISPLNFAVKQQDTLALRCEDTGSWIFDNRQFMDWLDGSIKFLWCFGIPGSGKTVLASIIIDHLERIYEKNDDVCVCYLYCDYNNEETTKGTNLIANLLRQLLYSRPQVPESVVNLHKHCSSKGTNPTRQELLGLIRAQVHSFSDIFLVIDALDEIPERGYERDGFIQDIHGIRTPHRGIRVLVTSRKLADIETASEGEPYLEVRANIEDIKKYVEAGITRSRRLKSLIRKDHSLRERLRDIIISKTDGMFLMARLHMNSVADAQNRRHLDQKLHSIPDELNDAYDSALVRIQKQPKEDVVLANRILSWILLALGPLSITELQHALAVAKDKGSIDQDMITDEEILTNVCCGFVVIDREGSKIRLVHFTLQEYLAQQWAQHISRYQADMASSCLQYLSSDAFATGPCDTVEDLKERAEKYPFLKYAASCWGDHVRNSGELNEDLMALIMCFLNDERIVATSKQAGEIDRLLHGTIRNCFLDHYPQKVTGLHVAAYFGLEVVVHRLLYEGAELNAKDSYHRTALDIAASRGQDKVVSLLLETKHRGRLFNPEESDRSMALHYAALEGQTRTMQLLVEAGTNINWLGVSGVSWYHESDRTAAALHLSCSRGHKKAVEWLLQNGAEVNLKAAHSHYTAMHIAAEKGYVDLVTLLVRHKGDIFARGLHNFTPLHLASEKGHLAVVQALLELAHDHVSIVNDRTTDGETPLILAAERHHIDVVRYLLDKGADVLAACKTGITPLHAPIPMLGPTHGDRPDMTEQTVRTCCRAFKLLITRGADIDAKNAAGHTPLSLTCSFGIETAVQYLIQVGADLDCRNLEGLTPLGEAIKNGQDSITGMLLNAGVNPELNHGRPQHTALHLAAAYSRTAIVQMLLGKNASISATDEGGGTMLHSLARGFGQDEHYGSEGAVDIYCGYYSNVRFSLRDRYYTRLWKWQLEFETEHIAIADLLVNAGADVNAKDCKEETPLFAAARYNRKSLFGHLLARGADTNITNLRGDSVLHHAIALGSHDILRILLDMDSGPLETQNRFGSTVLSVACSFHDQRNFSAAELLLQHGANPNMRNRNLSTALHQAAVWGNERIIGLLIDYGADVKAVDKDGHTLLHYAAYATMVDRNQVRRSMALDEPFSSDLIPQLATPFQSYKKIFSLLVERGVDENLKDMHGLSARQVFQGFRNWLKASQLRALQTPKN